MPKPPRTRLFLILALVVSLVVLTLIIVNRHKPKTPKTPKAPKPPVAGKAGSISSAKPIAAIKRAIVISIDGCRPDLLYRADAKNVLGLIHTGSFSLWARTSDIPVTLPSHTSMMTGYTPSRHQVTFNGYEPGHYPAVPTLFEVAHANGQSTAMVASKIKFHTLARPGSVDWLWIQDADAPAVAAEATRVILAAKPNVMLVHFRENDFAGHTYGWGSPQQLAALQQIDAAIGQVLIAIEQAGMADNTLIIVSADHGGMGQGHGPDAPGFTIPWIARGPGLHKNYDLTRRGSAIHTEDTFATVCWVLGMPIASDSDGKPVTEIINRTGEELLHDVSGTRPTTGPATTYWNPAND